MNCIRKLKIRLFVVSVFTLLCTVKAQELTIGNTAPPLEPFAWLKGEPVHTFDKGGPYVIEFGATWCKPCAAAIPRLNALAQKYRGKVQVVSVFVQEINEEGPYVTRPKYVEKVKEYVNQKGDGMSYTIAVDDPKKTVEKTWLKALNRSSGVPQTVVIDARGRIAAHFRGFNAKGVEDLLITMLEGSYDLDQLITADKKQPKREVYDYSKPLYVDGNGGSGEDFMFRSIITKAKPGVDGGDLYIDSYRWIDTERWWAIRAKYQSNVNVEETRKAIQEYQGRIQAVARSLGELYLMAYSDTLSHFPQLEYRLTKTFLDTLVYPNQKSVYGKSWYEPVLEVSDPTPFAFDRNTRENLWNYSFIAPKEKGSAAFMQKVMQKDLDTYFGYQVTVETRQMPCLFLKAQPGAIQKLMAKSPAKEKHSEIVKIDGKEFIVRKNFDIRYHIWLFDHIAKIHFRKQNQPHLPIVDRTGIPHGNLLNYKLPKEASKAFSNGDFEAYKAYIANAMGLYLEKGTAPMKVVVIRDPQS